MLSCAGLSSARSRKVGTVTWLSNGWRSSIARSRNGGKWGQTVLASCDPSVEPPDAVKEWKKMIEAAEVDQGAYAKALAAILGDLVCSNEADRIYVLRGLLRSDRFSETGAEDARAGEAHHQPGMSCLGGADGRRQNRDRRSGDNGGCFVQIPLIRGNPRPPALISAGPKGLVVRI